MRIRNAVSYPNTVGGGNFIACDQRRNDWRVVSVFFKIITSAVAGNRSPIMTLIDGQSTPMMEILGGYTIPASTAIDVTFGHNLQTGILLGTLNAFNICIGDDIWIRPQWRLTFGISGGDVGDQIQNATMQTEFVTEAVPKEKRGKPSAQEAP
jgi:hypothetical protein